MSRNSAMGDASSLKRLKRIHQLQLDFRDGYVLTVASAVKKYGYRRNTIIKWAKEGNVPLVDDLVLDHTATVVPATEKNMSPIMKQMLGM